MYNVVVKLIVVSIDVKRGLPKILIRNDELPWYVADFKELPKDCATKLLKETCDVDPEWAALKLVDVTLNDDGLCTDIIVLYKTTIPETIPVSEGYEWVDYVRFIESNSLDKKYIKDGFSYV